MKLKIGLYSFVLSIVLGCSSPSRNLKTTYDVSKKEGMIVGTVCIENKTYGGYTFFYTDDLQGVSDYPNLSDSFTYKYSAGDYNEKNKTYYLFSIVKPKGKYKFAKIKIYDNATNKIMKFEIPLDIKFVIEEGKTTYFGQLNVNTQEKKYTVEDQNERDRKWFLEKQPLIQF